MVQDSLELLVLPQALGQQHTLPHLLLLDTGSHVLQSVGVTDTYLRIQLTIYLLPSLRQGVL